MIDFKNIDYFFCCLHNKLIIIISILFITARQNRMMGLPFGGQTIAMSFHDPYEPAVPVLSATSPARINVSPVVFFLSQSTKILRFSVGSTSPNVKACRLVASALSVLVSWVSPFEFVCFSKEQSYLPMLP